MFYNKVVYKIIGSFICSFIDNLMCLGYLGILLHKLYAYDKKN